MAASSKRRKQAQHESEEEEENEEMMFSSGGRFEENDEDLSDEGEELEDDSELELDGDDYSDEEEQELIGEEEEKEKMEELEEEYRNLRNEEQNLVKNLRRHKDEDAAKGQAVKNQKAIWDKTLELRFLLQKAFSNSNKLPKEPIRSTFCSYDNAMEQAYLDLMESSQKTLSSMLKLQEVLLDNNHAVEGTSGVPHDSKGETDDNDWFQVNAMHSRIAPFRNNEVDKWQRKTHVTSGAAALKGKLHAFNQNISDQVAGYMKDPSRMISRMYLSRSSVSICGEVQGDSETTKEGNVDDDPELIDDSEFYQQLLKEFLESCDLGASEAAFYAIRRTQPKKRKHVDRRASKCRKIRYNVHDKIVNFMAPIPMNLPPMAPKLFENLFGFSDEKSTVAV